jgi:membrane protease YdiL (CAAX protease family)
MVIHENDEGLLNFFSPGIVTSIGLLLLGLGAWSLAALNFILPFLPPDPVMATIILNLGGQVLVTAVVLLLLIPRLHLKTVEYRPLTFVRTLKSVPAFCLVYTVAMGFGFVLYAVFDLLGIPVVHSYGAIVLTPTQLANPFNLVLFFATTTIGAAVSEEFLFRRTLIPSLETRGMAPLAAVLASSLGFSVIHMPNDILNGSLGYVIMHFVTTLTIGIVLGVSYVATRNVVFPMILHGLINLVSFGALIVDTIGVFGLLVAYALVILAVWIIGIAVGIIALWQVLKKPPAPWATVLRIKSKINILPGLLGYLTVAVGLVVLPVLGELAVVALLYPNGFLIYATVCLFYLLFLAVLLWLLAQARYKSAQAPSGELTMA